MASDAVLLAAGEAQVELHPAIGGAIASFRHEDHDVLRPAPESARVANNVRQFGCYPLVPWSNRIANATLRVGERVHALARNFGDHPHAIHGVGWQRAWRVVACEPDKALLALDHLPHGDDAKAWPFPFRATQAFVLTRQSRGATLTLRLSIENTGESAFPFGLGWHPFFPVNADTTLRFAAQGVWENEATCLPIRHAAIPDAWRFEKPRAMGSTALDNVFTGWRGEAEVAWPAERRRATIEADRACSHLVVYIPPERGFAAIEPATHMTDAFNRHARGERDTGTRMLPRGASHCCTMRIVSAPLH